MESQPAIRRQPNVRLRFYIGSVLFVAVLLLVTYYIDTAKYPVDPNLEPELDKAIDAYENLNNLLITLGTGILGAMGFLLTSRPKEHYRPRDLWPAGISAVFVGVSLYFGYLSYQNVQFVLMNSIGTLDTQIVEWPKALHFYSLLAGVFFFADFVIQHLSKAD